MKHTNNVVTKNVSLPKIVLMNLCFVFSRKVNLLKLKNKNTAQLTPFFKLINFWMVAMIAWSGCYVENFIETSFFPHMRKLRYRERLVETAVDHRHSHPLEWAWGQILNFHSSCTW